MRTTGPRLGGWLALLPVLAACDASVEPGSGYGLRLPDGDPARGRVVFERLECRACHDLADDPSPEGADAPPGFVTLGGVVTRVETHGELVTSVVNPYHEISRPPAPDSPPRMTNFNDRMTVAELIDLVAFLQERYEERPTPRYVR